MHFMDIAGRKQEGHVADNSSGRPRRIVWQSVVTVLSAAILIGAEVFGAAFAGGWALANLFGLGNIGVYVLADLFLLGGVAVMVAVRPQRACGSSRSPPQNERASLAAR